MEHAGEGASSPTLLVLAHPGKSSQESADSPTGHSRARSTGRPERPGDLMQQNAGWLLGNSHSQGPQTSTAHAVRVSKNVRRDRLYVKTSAAPHRDQRESTGEKNEGTHPYGWAETPASTLMQMGWKAQEEREIAFSEVGVEPTPPKHTVSSRLANSNAN